LGGLLGVLTAGVLASRFAGCATADAENITADAAIANRHAFFVSSEGFDASATVLAQGSSCNGSDVPKHNG
jgi:hypothetical protein